MRNQRNAGLTEAPVSEISGDRRNRRRYPISLPVQFKILRNCRVVGTGEGTSLDLSSGGIAFSTSSPLPVGSYVELSISWPVLLDQSCPLKLVALGRVVRSDEVCTAMTMDRHEFRTQGAKNKQATGAPATVAVGVH